MKKLPRLSVDKALIALFIGAMDANGHISPRELERGHHLVWSTRRFRHRDGDEVGRIIYEMRELIETSDADAVVAAAVKAIPRRLRPSAFAVVTDLLLADGRLDAQERAFLQRLGADMAIDAALRRRIVDVVLLKNQL